MRSSISNSDDKRQWPETYWKRPIPTSHWQGVSLLCAILVLLFVFAWEAVWRGKGYEPSFEETPELWATERSRLLKGNPDEVAIIGSSRVAFNLDLDVWEQDFGGSRPVMLSLVGTCPRPFLRDLANDEDFSGTVICGVTPLLFFLPDPAPPTAEAQAYVDHLNNRSISSRSDFLLSIPIESALASINKEDLSLGKLLRGLIDLPNREGARVLPPYPPYFGQITRDRRYHMWSKMETDPEFQHHLQQLWLPLVTLAPPFAGEGLEQLILSVKEDVEKIQSRGGKVIFVRCPATGDFRELENELWPRESYWDQLLQVTGVQGIHFEDYPQLNQFECPEWSHLSRSDAVVFTRNLISLIR